MIEKKTHVLYRVRADDSPNVIAEKVEEKLQKLEKQFWRMGDEGIFAIPSVIFTRMWREKK